MSALRGRCAGGGGIAVAVSADLMPAGTDPMRLRVWATGRVGPDAVADCGNGVGAAACGFAMYPRAESLICRFICRRVSLLSRRLASRSFKFASDDSDVIPRRLKYCRSAVWPVSAMNLMNEAKVWESIATVLSPGF